jgi:hypothetical protein
MIMNSQELEESDCRHLSYNPAIHLETEEKHDGPQPTKTVTGPRGWVVCVHVETAGPEIKR